MSYLDQVKLIQLPKISDPRGNLTFIEGGSHIPFDIARVEELSLQQRTAVTERLSAAQDVWLRYVSEMSAEDRSAYADRVDEALAHGPHRRSKR